MMRLMYILLLGGVSYVSITTYLFYYNCLGNLIINFRVHLEIFCLVNLKELEVLLPGFVASQTDKKDVVAQFLRLESQDFLKVLGMATTPSKTFGTFLPNITTQTLYASEKLY